MKLLTSLRQYLLHARQRRELEAAIAGAATSSVRDELIICAQRNGSLVRVAAL